MGAKEFIGASALIVALAAGSAASAQTAPVQAASATPQSSGLTFAGVTLYGTFDIGVANLNHGAPLSAYYGPGLPFMIQKFSNRPITSIVGNGLSQSKIGLSGVEPVNSDLSVVFKLETGFMPTSLHLADGPKSLVHSNGEPLGEQSDSGDAARAGQLFQGAAYVGVASKTWGALTWGRQNGLVLDDLIKYDPQAQSQAFSPIGYSGVAGGGGDTEDTRLNATLKYAYARGPLRFAMLHQFADGASNPGGTNEVDLGGDYGGLSADLVYAHVDDAIAASSLTAAQNLVHPGTLDATVSDNTTWSAQARYVWGKVKFYGGLEHMEYANPEHPLANGVVDIGGYWLSTVNDDAYAHHKLLTISWVGARYSITPAIDLTAAWYHYNQNSYKGNGCEDSSASSCSGSLNEMSGVFDDKLNKYFDVYLGVTYSNVENGLASGYLNRAIVGEMTGVRFNF